MERKPKLRSPELIEGYNKRGDPVKFKSVSFPYLKGSFVRLKFKLKKFNTDLIVTMLPKLKSFLNKEVDPLGQDDHVGAYEIPYVIAK